jgi:hypothetical protein
LSKKQGELQTYKVNDVSVGRGWSAKFLEGSQPPLIVEAVPANNSWLITGWVDNEGRKYYGNPLIIRPTDHLKGLRVILKLNEKASPLRIENDFRNLVPTSYILDQSYPNPFNYKTKIRYVLPERIKVNLRVYNVLGQQVAELVDEIQDAGQYEAEWNAETLEGGVYFYRLITHDFISVKKILLIK